MNNRTRLIRNIAIWAGAVLLAAVIAVVGVVRTAWFSDYVKNKIVSATEESTGGRVEIGAFNFDVWQLRAVVKDFVIHGTEPPDVAPFVRVARLQVDLRFFASFQRLLDIAHLGIDKPVVNIISFADGRTNIPNPKRRPESKQTALESVVDLAVGRFELTDGLVVLNSMQQQVNLRANNFRAQLYYNILRQSYQGQLSLDPLYVVSGRSTPVNFRLTLPVVLHSDRVDLQDASITTPTSMLRITGTVENLRDPRTSAHLTGHISLADLKNLGNLPLALTARGVPTQVDIDASAMLANHTIHVDALRLGMGKSTATAVGVLKDPKGNGALAFQINLALEELGRLANARSRPEGALELKGTAKLDENNNYDVSGQLEAENVTLQQGAGKLGNINISSALHLDPHLLDLTGFRLKSGVGEFDGNGTLRDFSSYQVNGNLRNLNIQSTARALGRSLPYDGIVSGPVDMQGDLKTPGMKSIVARARWSIAPGGHGIPVTGKLNADYRGDTGNIAMIRSHIALPHSRVNFEGSFEKRLTVSLTTSDLNDLWPAVGSTGKPPVVLKTGRASLNAVVTGSVTSPQVAGHLQADHFSVEERQFNSFDADIAASSSNALVRNGVLTRGPMQAQFSGSVGLQNWNPAPSQPLAADIAVRNGDLADLLALAGQPSAGYSGAVSTVTHVGGTVGNPQGNASLQIVNGTLQDQPFDRAELQISLSDQLITIPSAFIAAPMGRIELRAEYKHPRESFFTGQVHARVQTTSINLGQLRAVQKQLPNSSGTVQLTTDVAGTLASVDSKGKQGTNFLVSSVTANASARGLVFQGQTYGDFDAAAQTNARAVNYNLTSNFAGGEIRVNGNTQLVSGYPTTADANIARLPIERLLVLARQDIPARGQLSGSVHVSGTLENPQGGGDLELTRAVIYDEPIDKAQLQLAIQPQRVDVTQFALVAASGRLELSARYDHPAGDLKSGSLRFRVKSNSINLTRIRNLQKLRPGLGGTLQIAADGSATIQPVKANSTGLPVSFSNLTGSVAMTGIQAKGRNLGDFALTASTNSGRLHFALDSNLAGASIHGQGDTQLSGDFPSNLQLAFNNVQYTKFQELLGPGYGAPTGFEAVTDGRVSVSGPVSNIGGLRGSLQLTRLQVDGIPPNRAAKSVSFKNEGPVSMALERDALRIESMHIVGPQTDVRIGGSISRPGLQFNMTVNAEADLGIVPTLTPDIYSSGRIVLATSLRGTTSQPLVNGKLELHDASVYSAQLPNGISKANGLVEFTGNGASIRNLTAECGGGKLSASGYARFGEEIRFGITAKASGVHLRPQPGVSIVSEAVLRLSGTTQSSLVSGTIEVNKISYAPQSDLGSLLARSATPVQQSPEPSPLFDNMNLDVRVRTAPSLAVQTSLAQNVKAEGDLRVRGTASKPAVLGRVRISEGQLVFFGSTYTVNSGTISFYNQARIEPVLNINLETQAQGVDVILTVTGPIDDMKLSYTSDPPLQFQEIVSLLASGKTPTSDPTLLANQPQTQQSFQQMGEAAIVSKTLADPVSNSLKRVFGVSQFKIDPTFTSGSQLPTAQLTLRQQITSNVTFTYVSALSEPNSTLIRVEWAFNPQWSAVTTRDRNGIVSLNFWYKRQFR
jgi:translocation and assembly module TamB